MYNFHPYYDVPEGVDPLSNIGLTYAEDPLATCINWLSGVLGLDGEKPADGWPDAYCNDPFVLGFAHHFALSSSKSFGPGSDESHESFAREVFKYVFGGDADARHSLALRLRQFGQKDYVLGAENGLWFYTAYRQEREYLNRPDVAAAVKRAEDYVTQRTTAPVGSDEYRVWLREAENCALYDVLFLDTVRARFPDLVKWPGSALETMPEPPTLGELEDDWQEPEEDNGRQCELDFLQTRH